MPNYLNKPLSAGFRNTYTSQFVPLPLEIFARANERDQANQDAQVGELGGTSDALWKVQGVAPQDQEYTETLRKGFDEAAGMLAGKDLTQRENQDAAKTLIKSTTRDPSLNTIMSNAAKYAKYQENKADMIKNNTYQEYNDIAGMSFAEYGKKGGFSSGVNTTSDIFKYEDGRPVREQYVNNLREIGSETIHHIADEWYKDGENGISAGRLGAQVNRVFDEYLGTPAAAQTGRVYDQLVRSTNPKNLTKDGQIKGEDGKGISKTAYINQELISAAMEREGISYTTGKAAARTAAAKTKKAKEEAVNLFAGMESTENPSTLNGGRELKFDSTGQLKGSGSGIVEHFKKTGFSWTTFTNWKNDNSQNSDEAKDWHYINAGAKLNGVTPEQYAKVYDTTWHPIVPKPLIGKALEDNNNVFRKSGSGVWSNIVLSRGGESGMNFIDAVNKLGDEKGIDVPDANKDAEGFNKALDALGVRVTGSYAPNRNSARSIEIKMGGNTFAGDLTNGGSYMKGVTQEALDASNLDKLNGGEQVIEKDSKGNDVIYFKDIKTGKINHKFVKDLK